MSHIDEVKKIIIKKEMVRLIKKYNVLACPNRGVPRLTRTGKIENKGKLK